MGGAGGAEAPAKTLEGFWREEEEEGRRSGGSRERFE